jgi:hypothetical protein
MIYLLMLALVAAMASPAFAAPTASAIATATSTPTPPTKEEVQREIEAVGCKAESNVSANVIFNQQVTIEKLQKELAEKAGKK